MNTYEEIASQINCVPSSKDFASYLDEQDKLKGFRNEFLFPTPPENKRMLYLCGNSLGLQPKNAKQYIEYQLNKWSTEAVEGHFTGDQPWIDIDDTVSSQMAELTGAKKKEVVMMNSLTCNLHLMMIKFYKPTSERYKILMEKKAFPSDYHAVISQLRLHNIDPKIGLVEMIPRQSETTIREEDIIEYLNREGHEVALVLFSGIQYFTGQLFNMPIITNAAHKSGCFVGFDLAHAVGNVPLSLHEWGCDFACWCTYKYMNCGPGAIGGCFVHEKHDLALSNDIHNAPNVETDMSLVNCNDRLAGWWGHRREDRFLMSPNFIPCEGANGFRLSNPPILLIAVVKASLDIFEKAGMQALRAKSIILTGYLEYLLITDPVLSQKVVVFTPKDPQWRGCQLSLMVKDETIDIKMILSDLKKEGVICDTREPNILRVAPTPLYNSFMDVLEFVMILKDISLLRTAA